MADSQSQQPVNPRGPLDLSTLSSAEKRALLKRLAAGQQDLPPLPPQRSPWFLEQLNPGAAHYNLMFAWRLHGPLDVTALERALNHLRQRHAGLRVTFRTVDDGPRQRINPYAPQPLTRIGADAAAPAMGAQDLLAHLRGMANQPFDLEAGPLHRFALLQADADTLVLAMVFHHIIVDNGAAALLTRDLAALYRNAGRPATPPPKPPDYAAVCRQSAAPARAAVRRAHLDWWRDALADMTVTEFPSDHPRPAEADYRAGRHVLPISPTTRAALETLSRNHGLSPFAAGLAVFMLLLHRYSGARDVNCGIHFANRTTLAEEQTVGFFTSTLIPRVTFADGPSFAGLATRLAEFLPKALAHGAVPFHQLVQALAPERDPGRTPLYSTTFHFERQAPLDLPGLSATPCHEMDYGRVRSDLELYLNHEPTSPRLILLYRLDLFKPERIQALARHYTALAAAAAAHGRRPVADLPLLSPDERRRLLTRAVNPAPLPFQAMPAKLAHIAARHPERRALVDGNRHLSLAHFNRLADRLSGRLRERGVQAGDTVAILMPPCLELLIAVYAVLKTGAAYVPIDTKAPTVRMDEITRHARVRLMLTRHDENTHEPPVPVMDVNLTALRFAPDAQPLPVRAADAAYIIYTSGSTGKPKGVVISHGALSNLIQGLAREFFYDLDGADTAMTTPFVFDVSLHEIAAPALGHCLHIMPSEIRGDPRAAIAFLAQHRIRLSSLAPPLFLEALIDADLAAGAPLLERVSVVGEKVSQPLWDRLRTVRGIRFYNFYGPTEATVYATGAAVTAPHTHIGDPFPNYSIHVVNDALQLNPPGAPGELLIGGPSLARGYLHQPGLTAAQFVPDPFSDQPGSRLYKTGDQVKIGHGLEYLGRRDGQLKLRGFRVEVGEIEAVLLRHPHVARAAVLVREDRPGLRMLVAYVTGADEACLPQVPHEFLAAHLPHYMIPAAVLPMTRFPLTPSGKLDRKALPAPRFETRFKTPPRNPIETTLTHIWAEVLNLDDVGVHDDFFELGGHSLAATRVVSRIRALLQRDLSLQTFFRAATPAATARALSSAQPPALPLTHRPQARPVLSYAQERLWFLAKLEPDNPWYNMTVALELTGPLDTAAFATALNQVLAVYEGPRTRFPGGVPVVQPPRPIDLTVQPLPANIDLAIPLRRFTHQAYNLEQGPLFRAALLRLEPKRHVFAFGLHHIIADGWSQGLLVRDLGRAYRAALAGEPNPLTAPPLRYLDYAAWQRDPAHDDRMTAQLDWWRRHLAQLPPDLDLPLDFPRPSEPRHRGRTLRLDLPGALAAGVNRAAAQAGVTPFMVLLATYHQLLARYSNRTDIPIGAPSANRGLDGTETIFGLFVNMLVLRLNPDAAKVAGLLQQIKAEVLAAFDHGEPPFEKLVETLNPDRDLSRNPIFQVSFAFQNLPLPDPNLPDITWRLLDDHNPSAKFDIALAIFDGPPAVAPTGLHLTWEFDSDLFQRATAQRMIRHFQTLLAALIDHPNAALATLPMLSAAEKRELLAQGENPQPFPPAQTPAQALHHVAVRFPNRTALHFEGRELDFATLDSHTNRLAALLRERGVAPGDLVAVRIRPSLDMVLAVFAVTKAGAAWLPLNPDAPAHHVNTILRDAKPTLMLTVHNENDDEPPVPVLNVNANALRFLPDADPTPVTPDFPAYVIYTSGSTGRPKGVVVSHRALWNQAHAMGRGFYADVDHARVLLSGPIYFDVSVTDLAALLFGHTLYITPRATREDPTLAAAYLIHHRIQLANLSPPAYLESLLNTGLFDRHDHHLIRVSTAGEKIRDDLWRRLSTHKTVAFHNLYGPTETTIYASGCRLTGARSHIGTAVANYQTHITDHRLNPAPQGAVGELLIGGAGLARGYLNQPARTAETFIPDPFATQAGARLYKSGDLVRRTDLLLFLGRRDHQFKLRGYRIEAGEIEAALLTHPSVHEAAVLPREDRPGVVTLIAYAAGPHPDTLPDRTYLTGRLPDYMIPNQIIALPKLPRTGSGKLDRAALPAPSLQPSERVAPRTDLERQLAAVWCDVLHLDQVGVTDDFFKLGGHSLSAAAVTQRVQQRLGRELRLKSLFQNPTIAALAEHLSTTQTNATIAPITPAPPAQHHPLSHAQRRLWTLHPLLTRPEVYNMAGALHLDGPLNVDALRQSLTRLIARHDILRTRFIVVDDQPRQLVDPPHPFNLEFVELSEHPDPVSEAHRLAHTHAAAPFDLNAGPPLRISLLRLGANQHVFCFNQHHIIGDGWSLGVLLREIGEQYHAARAGKGDDRPPLPIQYKDFAHHQRRQQHTPAFDAHRTWWRNQMKGQRPTLDLPYDRPRPTVQTYPGAHHRLRLNAPLTNALKAMAHQARTGLFSVLTAVLKTLLMRYSGATEILLGTVHAGRTHPMLEDQIGCYLNTLVLRRQVDADLTFPRFLTTLADHVHDAFAHQDVPFDLLVEDVGVTRDLSRSPLFDVLIILHSQGAPHLQLDSMKVSPFGKTPPLSKLDLTFNFTQVEDRLHLDLEYNTDLFDRATAERLCDHFVNLADAATTQSDVPLGLLPYLGAAERARALQAEAPVPYPKESVLQLLSERAAQAPDAPALHFESQTLTRADLIQQTLNLAALLQSRGLRPETPVGIFMAPSHHRVIAQAAVLACGAFFMPLDPNYPAERLTFMLNDARPALLLSDRSLDAPGATVLRADQGIRAGAPFQPPVGEPQQAAYLTYTSGSTGRPKGVVGRLDATLNRLAWMWRAFPYTARDRCCRLVSLNFVDAVWELWCPLLQGVPISIVPEPVRTNPEALHQLLTRDGVTRIILVPSLLRALLDLPAIPTLQTWFVSGETLPPDLVRQFSRRYPSARLINLYGSSEVAGDATAAVVDSHTPPHPGGVPIGRPITNLKTLVLDPHLNPVAPGVIGELYVGGAGLARGYHGRGDLTAQRFMPDPHAQSPGARLFRTGDLAAADADGALYFHGRRDAQIKLRGVRIELGEIEAVLNLHPNVDLAAVLLRGEGAAARLTAYLQTHDGQPIPDLPAVLAQHLPAVMIPTAYHVLTMPLTPNGKLDRAALPDVLPEERPQTAPRTPLEHDLADIWCEVLNLETVDVHHNFFELGGNSLNLTAVAGRIRRRLGLQAEVLTLFQAPTIATLAQTLRHAARHHHGPIPRLEPRDTYPLSRAQQRLWAMHGILDLPAAYNLPVVNRILGPLDLNALTAAFTALVQRHESLRTRFETSDRRPVQRIVAPFPVTLPITDLSAQSNPDDHARQHIQADLATPFNLATTPLFRVHLYRLAPQNHVIAINLHHIIADGWSGAVLARELLDSYDRRRRNQGPDPDPLPIQYRDYAAWRNAQTTAESGEWWRNHLLARLPAAPLPGNPRPAVLTHRGRTDVELGAPALFADLRRFARARGVSFFAVLAAALDLLLSRHTGADDVIFGTPVAGRNHPDLEDQIGFYLNPVAMAQTLDPRESLVDLISRVAADAALAFQHQDYPFDALVHDLQQTDTARAPVFDVLFVLQNMAGADLSHPELTIQPFPVDAGFAKYDLTLTIDERGPQTTLAWEVNTHLFPPRQAAQWRIHYTRILQQIIAHPNRKTGEVQLLSTEEKAALLATWQGDRPPLPHPTLAAAMDSARRRADATPVLIAGRTQWTFAQLETAAQSLAAQLRQRGIGHGDWVGVCMSRTAMMPAALWAVMQCGAAWLPLDPNFPAARLETIVTDANPKLILLSPDTVDTWNALALDGFDHLIATPEFSPTPAPPTPLHPQSPAYVIYTSGSTGTPKGVVIPHQAVVNFLAGMDRRFALKRGDRFLAVTTLSFDIAVLELILPLLSGAALVLADAATAADGAGLAALLHSADITHMQATPAGWRLLHAAGWTGKPDLHVLCGGEALPQPLAARLLHHNAALHNLYGPTETTVWSAHAHLTSDQDVHIGEPLEHTGLFVLDRHGALCPDDVIGELWISGQGLARGYQGRADLTAERFRPNPFHGDGARLYHTGDLARRDCNGRMTILGRTDHQVKIRGYRIELGEIEATLSTHPHVAVAAVIVHQPKEAAAQPIAFIQPRAATAPTDAELERWCAQKLPAYMVPSRYVRLDALPKTPNGKLDRAAMIPPETHKDHVQVAPRTETESLLAALWADILKHPRVGIHDNFFALGGDSISAMTLVTEAAGRGLTFTAGDVFAARTIAVLAQRTQTVTNEDQAVTPYVAQILNAPGADSAHWTLQLELNDQLTQTRLQDALNQMEERHEALRLRFHQAASGWRQRVASPQGIAIATHPPQEPPQFNLTQGPLIRAHQTQSARQITLHLHTACVDAPTLALLTIELIQRCQNQAPPPPLPWRRAAAQIDIWANTSWPPSAQPTTPARTVTLTGEETSALLHDLPARHRTDPATLIAAVTLQATRGRHIIALADDARRQPPPGLDFYNAVGPYTVPRLIVPGVNTTNVPEILTALKTAAPPDGATPTLVLHPPPVPPKGQSATSWTARDHRPQTFPLELRFHLESGRLCLSQYGEDAADPNLIQTMAKALRDLLNQDAKPVQTRPADFPMAGLKSKQLNKLLARHKKR